MKETPKMLTSGAPRLPESDACCSPHSTAGQGIPGTQSTATNGAGMGVGLAGDTPDLGGAAFPG